MNNEAKLKLIIQNQQKQIDDYEKIIKLQKQLIDTLQQKCDAQEELVKTAEMVLEKLSAENDKN